MVDKIRWRGVARTGAGSTALCTVGVSGTGLTYRGYDITDLADNTCFEEVAFNFPWSSAKPARTRRLSKTTHR